MLVLQNISKVRKVCMAVDFASTVKVKQNLLRGQIKQIDRLGFYFSALAEVLENDAWWVVPQ